MTLDPYGLKFEVRPFTALGPIIANMAFLFARNKQKSGVDLVKNTSELMLKLDSEEKASPKVGHEIPPGLYTHLMLVIN